MSCGKDHQKEVLEAMRKAGRPVKAGDLSEMTGLEKKEVDKIIAALKKDNKCQSPKRCFYTPVD
ncbi:MAG: transcriptional regulator [Candidatus Krumholzibacteriota bacterium]|nr:transcriptional regulator [Candidatus Krumholzibacteriota bacterium]